MFSITSLSVILATYFLILFILGQIAEKHSRQGANWTRSSWLYALSLSVYCTTWTYYGSVGSATTNGMLFFGIYLGPMLCILLWWIILRKLVRIKNSHKITSLADFVSARYNKSIGVGVIATLLVLLGIIPYIGLQIRAIITTVNLITPHESLSEDSLGFLIIISMTFFTIIFGLRKLDPTERHPGMMMTITAEGILKLIGFVAAGLFVTYSMFNGFEDIFTQFSKTIENQHPLHFFDRETAPDTLLWMTYMILAGSAILFLPRQFHVAVIENSNEKHIATAMWAFPIYLFLINLFVIPIAFGGLIIGESATTAESFVLTLPLKYGEGVLLPSLVFIGGFSAGAGMIMIESMAVSTMISNNLILPTLGRLHRFGFLKKNVLPLRWVSAFLLITAGFVYQKANQGSALISMGMISFAAVIQFAPVVLGGLFWTRGNRKGAIAGLLGGSMIWLYTLYLPVFMKSGTVSDTILKEGPFGINLLKPESLFGLSGLHPLTHAMIWSMIINIGLYIIISVLTSQCAEEEQIAEQFIHAVSNAELFKQGSHSIAETDFFDKSQQILNLLYDYYPKERAQKVFDQCLANAHIKATEKITIAELSELYNEIERHLSGAIGAASAHMALKEKSIITASEQKSLSEFYADMLADMKISPTELKQKIDFHKERESILQNQAIELERKLKERDEENKQKTLQVYEANKMLTLEIEERQKIQKESEELHKQLLGTAKQAGMAEMANSVLHNVGNVLNSVNTSLSLVKDKMKSTKVDKLAQVSQILDNQKEELGRFITEDPRGQAIPSYIKQLSKVLTEEKDQLSREINYLQENVNHIKSIISVQQTQAKSLGVIEDVKPIDVLEDAIKINTRSIQNHHIELVKNITPTPSLLCDKHKLLQVLVNLISNAKDAVSNLPGKRLIQAHLYLDGHDTVVFEIVDNGVGIPKENLDKIFRHGFTTKQSGHGFGLHSGALAVEEMGGKLIALSDGENKGARFQIRLPLTPFERTIETK
ncbi:MAG: hypothetical protein BroJett040_11130 [Oligoflexia bacterium]|nr:MAG: hypothetical protein BroJett040_11130 [Oligoflexia bacterium]